MPARQGTGIKLGHRNPVRTHFLERGMQPGEICLLGQQEEINILAKLRCALEHAGLAAHKQGLHLMFLHRK
jgi:hypothetical protein